MSTSPEAKVSAILREFVAGHPGPSVTIQDMVHGFGQRAFGFLLLVFALVCMIPLPIPGIHMFLSLPLFYLSLQQIMGRQEVWFPQKVLSYSIPRKSLEDVVAKTLPWVEKVENISKPRLNSMTSGLSYRAFGALVFYITAFLAIPLPLTNFIPAVGIALIALGLLMKDGLAMIIGTVIGVLWSLIWFAVGVSGLIFIFKQTLVYFL